MKLAAFFLIPAMAYAQEFAQGWMGEYEHASKQIHQLLEATPEAKLSWRPAPGIRSTAEVYGHIIQGNYFLLRQAGIASPGNSKDMPKSFSSKAEMAKWLKDSEDAVRAAYPKADMKKAVKFLGKDTTVEGVFLRLLVHSHEHMGQLIAYARSTGVVPPWSAK
ncbi:MAG: DinB family protein [Acidobacteria bacterium]|nr:DinB family protein [Acidobacteriota bacterium]